MKLYAPKYYKNFVCVADRCRHSCCVGWEIDIDGDTVKKYAALNDGYGEKIKESIESEGVAHFRLCDEDRCPHLNKNGLCNIITEVGEDFLCDICREHPRFYNDLPNGKEVGLGMACEEACRIILNSDEYNSIIPIGECDCEDNYSAFDTIRYRQRIFSVLSSSLPYSERLKLISAEFGVSADILSDGEWREIISSLEYLKDDHKELFLKYSSNTPTPCKIEKPLERALAYFIFRHCACASDYGDFLSSLCFCLFCERLLCSVAVSEGYYAIDDIQELARIISEEIEYSEDNTDNIKFEISLLI